MSVAEQAQRLGKKIEDYVMALPSWAQEIVDEIGRTNPLGEREKEEASSLLGGLESKLPFATNSLQVVTKRYLIKNLDGKILETPEQMFYRVARNIALHESEFVFSLLFLFLSFILFAHQFISQIWSLSRDN